MEDFSDTFRDIHSVRAHQLIAPHFDAKIVKIKDQRSYLCRGRNGVPGGRGEADGTLQDLREQIVLVAVVAARKEGLR